MAEHKDWAERRQRIVKCKIHGLRYDPELTSGCARCRKEGLDAAPRQKPQLVVLLLALLGIMVIIYRIIESETVRADLAGGDAETVADIAPASPSRLDPEQYEAGIRAVEAALFDTPAEDLTGMGEQIELALQQLGRQLKDDASPQTRTAIQAIAELTERSSASTLSLGSLHDLRDGWVRLRSRHFLPVMWYVTPRSSDPSTDRAALTTYRGVADDLVTLLDEGSGRALSLSESTAPNFVDPDDAARKQEEWRLFRSDWQQRITDLNAQLPRRPGVGADPQVLVAIQRLERAFSEVSSLASSELPSEARLDNAVDTVDKARQSFDDLLLK